MLSVLRTPMRAAFAASLLMLIAGPGVAQPAPADINPPPPIDRNQARWAEWEAQARMTDGDYDGAVQAQQQAESNRREADRQEALARASKR
jgi:hypothetical protein